MPGRKLPKQAALPAPGGLLDASWLMQDLGAMLAQMEAESGDVDEEARAKLGELAVALNRMNLAAASASASAAAAAAGGASGSGAPGGSSMAAGAAAMPSQDIAAAAAAALATDLDIAAHLDDVEQQLARFEEQLAMADTDTLRLLSHGTSVLASSSGAGGGSGDGSNGNGNGYAADGEDGEDGEAGEGAGGAAGPEPSGQGHGGGGVGNGVAAGGVGGGGGGGGGMLDMSSPLWAALHAGVGLEAVGEEGGEGEEQEGGTAGRSNRHS